MDVKERLVHKYKEKVAKGEYISPEFDCLVSDVGDVNSEIFRTYIQGGLGLGGNLSGGSPVPNPPITNRGVYSRNDKNPIKPLNSVCMGGYDGGLEVGYFGEWDDSYFQSLIKYLESNRLSDEFKSVILNGNEFILSPYGSNSAIHYRYLLEGQGLQIKIHNKPTEQIQPIRVRFGFESLVGRNFFDVYSEFICFLSSLGFTISKEIISRVDLQVMVNRNINDFLVPILSGWCVRSFYKFNVYTDSCGNTSGLSGGVGIKLRIYNKTQELLDTNNEFKASLLSHYCTGGFIPTNLTRIEYSVGRDFLNDCCLNTVQDLQELENSLVNYLTYDWFRLLDSKKTVCNASRQSVHKIWQEVQDLFNEYFPGVESDRIFSRSSRKMKGLNCDSRMLNSQAIGCLCSAIALSHGVFSDKEEAKKYLMKLFDNNSDLIMEKIKQRVDRNRILTGYDPSKVSYDYQHEQISETMEFNPEKLRNL
jgi:hypothetical protein